MSGAESSGFDFAAVFAFLYLLLWIVIPIVILVLGWLVYDKRYKSKTPGRENQPQNGFLPTPEVFIDPKDGLRYRVYYNPYTGERDYIRE
ncbi:HD family phosphohydrolase [Paenibacillus mesotrionivorans]|uniref:HD family phosphohydrolase n=1 Tax=Paenibacillus mesotrionivorans TaxID=3160968 RepID=A0ACC7NWD1_9BACL